MKKFFQKIKNMLPSKRKLIQLYSALLFNANLKGFINGRIYQGPLKNICTPGLNCYSCPGASGACPLGSLQNELGAAEKRTPYYVIGILLLYGILFGRFICGFLCPFGFIQELLYKIKTPKLKKNRFTRLLSYFKYVLLVFLVVIVPILYGLRNIPLPGFCKYICPAGTLEGAIGLLSNRVNESELNRLGWLFTWKFALLVSFLVGAIFIFRVFCRFFCPLGAIYGLFNKISVFGIKLNAPECVDCGRCTSKCKMDIRKVGDHECISCGECVEVCPTNAIRWNGSGFFIPSSKLSEISPTATPEEITAQKEQLQKQTSKLKKRKTVVKIVAGILMAALLATALVYYNVIDKPPQIPVQTITDPSVGNKVGDKCYGQDIQLYGENGLSEETFNPAKNEGKITIINFWGTWCGGCVAELPYFDRIASEYADSVTVLAIHTHFDYDTAPAFIAKNYPDSKILFGKDVPPDSSSGYSDDLYYSLLGGSNGTYPITIVLDQDGVIIASIMDAVTYDRLYRLVEDHLH